MSLFNPLQPVNGLGTVGGPPIAMIAGRNAINSSVNSGLIPGGGVVAVPSNTSIGGVCGNERMYHVVATITAAPGTFTFAHGLPWAPTACWIVPRYAENVSTAATFVAYCAADTNTGNVAFNVSATGTFDIYYG